ncbi:MAG: FAD-dependent oxidoreductase [Alphaproteobacteria bacterium]|nr:FAD-dependent oxidoreductase [Alphaproteobacteria bacterium]
MMASRLPAPAGVLIDRSKPITFNFCGQDYTGFQGDTIASALAANGVGMLSRSFKYHRPRGLMTAAGQDANTLVQIGDEPNVLADLRAIEAGLAITAQNVFGSLANDYANVLDGLGRFLPVGFYYKTFFRPKGAWRYWEKLIRALAGLGKVDVGAHHGYYDKQYLFCDVAVVGGGAAGLAAAQAAAAAGADVILIEENVRLGGALNYARFDVEGRRGRGLRADLVPRIEADQNIRVLTGAFANGWFADHWIPVIQGNRMYKLRAGAVVIASGSYEQPLVFRNNDLPGVMFSSAAQRLIKLYGVKPGTRAVVATANADGYGAALDLLDAGVDVACIADLRPQRGDGPLADAVRDRGVPIVQGATVSEAIPQKGNLGIEAARVAKITGQGTTADVDDRFGCDLIVTAVGYNPTANLIHHAGGTFVYNDDTAMFELTALPQGMQAAGSVNGSFDIDAVIEDGGKGGWSAARNAGCKVGPMPTVRNDRGAFGVNHPWPIFPHPKGRDFIDFDEDLQVHDILDAIAEGYDDVELMKRFSTCGMGPSQGRHSSLNSVRLTARATGRSVTDTGTTTSRPPYAAETFGVLAGRSFEPERKTAMHHRHLELGARMMPAGQWWRPEYYGPPERRSLSIREEAAVVREAVGIIDVSTLGGLEVCGPDAAEFLNRVYTFAYAKQPVGRARYLLMTDQHGVIIDDGVACRLHDHHFYVTATTSGVGGVYQHMLFWNAQWRLQVNITNATASWCGVNLAGPKARDVLAAVCTDVDLSSAAFPYMAVREGTIAGVPARIIRIGFVGELGYEIHAPASQGEALWDALMVAGEPHGIRPFGIEAQRLLRLEKGHIIIGQDTDGLTNAIEAEMAWAISRNKPYFVGKRALAIQEKNGIKRKLVGFTLGNPADPAPKESHLVIRDGEITGRTTSVNYSYALGRTIGLAYVATDQAEPGTAFQIRIEKGRMIDAVVTKPPFYDPDGRRQEL